MDTHIKLRGTIANETMKEVTLKTVAVVAGSLPEKRLLRIAQVINLASDSNRAKQKVLQ